MCGLAAPAQRWIIAAAVVVVVTPRLVAPPIVQPRHASHPRRHGSVFFALVLAGWLAARQRVLPEAAIPGPNAYVLYFVLPCLLLRFDANTPVLDLLNPAVLLVYAGCALLIVGLTVLVSRNARVGPKDAAFGALVAAFPNTGFMGVPLLVFQLTVLTLAAGLPSASNVSLLTARYGADSGRVARIILASTVLAFGSFTALVWWFGVRPGG